MTTGGVPRASVALALVLVATSAARAQTAGPIAGPPAAATNQRNIATPAEGPTASDPATAVASDAAPAPGSSPQLGDIIVTATRRAGDVQRLPQVINVISSAQLETQGVTNARDLIDALPGLAITQSAASANISIFGIGGASSSAAYTDPTVAFSIDGVPIARQFSTTSAMYDLQRVEVLKGPQGTLYGRNATAGAINVLPARPTQEFEGEVLGDVGSYGTLNTTGIINVPITSTLAVRGAFHTDRHRGYYTNGYGDADDQGGRISLLWKPTTDVSLLLAADYFHDGSKGNTSIPIFSAGPTSTRFLDPSNPWTGLAPAGCGNPLFCPTYKNSTTFLIEPFKSQSVSNNDGFNDNRQLILHGQLDWDVGPATLTVLPAYIRTKINYFNYSAGGKQSFADDANQESVEARLSSNGQSRFKWLVGGIWFREHQDATARQFEQYGYQVARTPNLLDTSYAFFGEATYAVLDRLRVTGGLRYTSETKSQDGYLILDLATVPSVTTCPPPAVPQLPQADSPAGGCYVPSAGRQRYTNVSYKAAVEFDLAPRSLVYANVRSGFKAGGLIFGLPPNEYLPEKMTAYEIGTKNRFFGNKLQLNVSAFYWDFERQQISASVTINPPVAMTTRPFNVPGFVEGIETGLDFLVTPHDQLTANLVYERGKYKVYPATGSTLSFILPAYTNYPRVNLPTWTGTVGYQHTFELGNGAKVIGGGNVHAESGTWLDVAHRFGTYRDAFANLDLTLSYVTKDDRFKITGYVNNATDAAVMYTATNGQIGPSFLYRLPTNPAVIFTTLAPPRTYGVRVQAKF